MITYHWLCTTLFLALALIWSREGWLNLALKLMFAGLAMVGVYLRVQ